MADRYWIATSSGNWNDTANWSDTSTGAGGSSVPTASDNVYFTSSRNGDCVLNATANVLNLVFTDSDPAISTVGYEGTLSGASSLSVYGGYCWFSSTMTMTATGYLVFRYGGGVSLNCGVSSFTMKIVISTAGTIVYPRDDLYYANARSTYREFDTGLDITAAGAGLDFTVFEKTFYVLTNWLKISIDKAGDNALKLWNLIYIVPNGKLEFQYGTQYGGSVGTGKKILVDNNLTIKSSSEEEKIYFGMAKADFIAPGWDLDNRFEFTVNGVVDIDNCIMSNIKADGDKWDLTSTNTSNGGGNDNIDFAIGITSYYVGGAANGNFNDSTKWRTTSGGTLPARVPLCQDTARIDGNSFSGSRTLTFNKTYLITQQTDTRQIGFYPKIDFTGSSDVTFDTTAVWYNRYGGVNLQDLDTINITTSGPWVFINDDDSFLGLGTHDIAPNIIFFYGTGKLSLVSNLSFTAYVSIGLARGSFDTNNYNISCSRFNFNGSGTLNFVRSANFRNSVLTFAGDSTPITINDGRFDNLTLDAGTSTIRLTGVNPFGTINLFGGFTFYNLEIATTTTAPYSEREFTLNSPNANWNSIKIEAGSNLKFTAGTTNYVKNFIVEGTSVDDCILGSNTTSAFTLVKTGTGLINNIDYCKISYSTVSPANTWYAGDNSTDEGNNSGWLFEAAPPEPVIHYKTVTDVITLDDPSVGIKIPKISLKDSVVLFDSDVKHNSKVVREEVVLFDSLGKVLPDLELSDEIDLVDSVSAKIVGKSFIDSVILDEKVIKKDYEGSRSLRDKIVLFDSDVKKNSKFLDDVVNVNDSVLKKTSKTIVAHCPTLNDSLGLGVGKILSDGLGVSDVLGGFGFGKSLSDEVVLFDAGSKDFVKVLVDEVVLKEVLSSGSFVNLSDGLGLSDDLSKVVGKSVLSEVLLSDFVFKKSLVSVVSEVGLSDLVVGKSVGKLLSSEVFLVDDLGKVSFKVVSDKVSVVDSDFKHIMKVFGDFLVLSDKVVKKALIVSDDVVELMDVKVVKSVNKVVLNEVELSEFVCKFVSRFYLSKVSLLDVVNKKMITSFSDKLVLDDELFPVLKPTIRGMQSDFVNILYDLPSAEYVDWIRYGEIEDEFGRIKKSSVVFNNKIFIVIQPISEKDRSFLPRGLNESSFMKAYAEPRYYFGNKRLEIEVGDVLVRSDGWKYVVETIVGKYGNFKAQVFRKLFLKGVDNG